MTVEPAWDQQVEPRPLAAGAQKVRLLAEEHAERADREGRPAGELPDAILDAGFARHFVPERLGGSGGSFGELTEAVTLVGTACTSSAWLASLAAYSARFAAYLPDTGQDEVWNESPDVPIASALVPSGSVDAVPGGWRVSGEWAYISGVGYSTWAVVGGPRASDQGEQRFFAIPRRDYGLRETWDSVGMRATLSDTLVVDDVFVPEHRSFLRAELSEGSRQPRHPRACQAPLRAVSGLAFGAPILGAVFGALHAVQERLAVARDGRGNSVHGKASALVAFARADGLAQAAGLLVRSVAERCDSEPFTALGAARNGRDTALAVELLTEAAQELFRLSGTSGQATGRPVQRFWRDVNSAATHTALGFEVSGLAYARGLLHGGEQ